MLDLSNKIKSNIENKIKIRIMQNIYNKQYIIVKQLQK